MKKILFLFLICILCISLFACGKEDIKIPEETSYYDNMSVFGLAKNAEEELVSAPAFTDIIPEILSGAGGISLSLCDQYVAKKADSGRLDEYGIFHCAKGNSVDSLYQSIQSYVHNRQNDTLTLSHYADADTVKNGKVAVYGNYVVYTFLPDNGNTLFHSFVESILTE